MTAMQVSRTREAYASLSRVLLTLSEFISHHTHHLMNPPTHGRLNLSALRAQFIAFKFVGRRITCHSCRCSARSEIGFDLGSTLVLSRLRPLSTNGARARLSCFRRTGGVHRRILHASLSPLRLVGRPCLPSRIKSERRCTGLRGPRSADGRGA